MGRRKTICGSWLLHVVNTTEVFINVAFIDGFNNRKAPRAVGIHYAETFCSQKWSNGSDNDLNRYCSYSGDIHVVIVKEIVF